MKYEVGDTILLLHSNEEGKVVEIMSEEMVMVNVDGVEFPVFMDQIDFPYFKRFSEQSKRKKEAEKNRKLYIDHIPKERPIEISKPDAGVQFSFFPVYDGNFEDDINRFKIFLINQNNEPYNFEYRVFYKEPPDFVITNEVMPQNDFYLHDVPQEGFNDIIKFQFRFSLVQPDKKRADAFEKTIKIRAKQLFQKIAEMHRLNVPSFSFELFFRYPARIAEEYFPLPEKPLIRVKAKKATEPIRTVIDLHIEKLTDNFAGLSNFEIMQIQLAYFEKYYDIAVSNMQPKLIVIHGVGSGRLRNEIHERLRTKKEVKTFVNQYHASFGFGATEIYFKY